MDRAKEPRQNIHNREQDGKGKTYHEVTMEKGPKRKHDKKTKSSSNCDPPGSADHEPIGEEPEAQNATSPPQLAGPSQPRRLSGRKKKARNRSKLYREKELLKIRLRQQHRLTGNKHTCKLFCIFVRACVRACVRVANTFVCERACVRARACWCFLCRLTGTTQIY